MQYNPNNDSLVSAEIIKILKSKSKYGSYYYDVLFRMTLTGNCYRSCIYPSCRNYENWTGLLKVGNVLDNLRLITKYKKTFVDADSWPSLIRKSNPEINQELKSVREPIPKIPKVIQQNLFGD